MSGTAVRPGRRVDDPLEDERWPLLLFAVAGRLCALPLGAVDGIVPWRDAIAVAEAPAVLRGVMQIPGDALAVLDMALLLECGETVPAADSSVLVSGRAHEAGGLSVGLLVDRVERVVELGRADVAPPPLAGGLFAAAWIAGMARTEAGLVPVLDLGPLLASPEIRAAVSAASTAVEELGRESR